MLAGACHFIADYSTHLDDTGFTSSPFICTLVIVIVIAIIPLIRFALPFSPRFQLFQLFSIGSSCLSLSSTYFTASAAVRNLLGHYVRFYSPTWHSLFTTLAIAIISKQRITISMKLELTRQEAVLKEPWHCKTLSTPAKLSKVSMFCV